MKVLINSLIITLMFFGGLYSQPPGSEYIPQNREYFSLIHSFLEGGKISFEDLRFAYAKTTMYDPYFGGVDEKQKMREHYMASELDKATKYANDVLRKNFLDIDAHVIMAIIYSLTGETEKQNFHRHMFTSLLQSIRDSGDGKSMETAYKVISVREEYNLLDSMEYRVTSQASLEKDGRYYDRLEAVNSQSGEKKTFYFDVTIPKTWLEENMFR